MRIALILLALAFGLQACGLKGPLVLPTAPAAPAVKPAPPANATPPTTQDKPAG